THVDKSFWMYGLSSVNFESDKVVSWSNSEGNLKANLKSKLLIVDEEDKGDLKLEKISTKGYFQLGSTTDELKSVMGVPDNIEDHSGLYSYWYYGNSKVKIVKEKVTVWENKGNLKIR
ncbi:MAG: hypothetical protein MK510_14065, partial [SAR324 cluster bacterium]|nr:hypothetical protein [SAR324 cluster bacterium]